MRGMSTKEASCTITMTITVIDTMRFYLSPFSGVMSLKTTFKVTIRWYIVVAISQLTAIIPTFPISSRNSMN